MNLAAIGKAIQETMFVVSVHTPPEAIVQGVPVGAIERVVFQPRRKRKMVNGKLYKGYAKRGGLLSDIGLPRLSPAEMAERTEALARLYADDGHVAPLTPDLEGVDDEPLPTLGGKRHLLAE